ncbi:MAG: hypothetical protein ACKVVP_02090 [Chloroflexota bacterium]
MFDAHRSRPAERLRFLSNVFLQRLAHLVDLERETPSTNLPAHTLIQKAQVSTFQDCVDLGYREEARTILRKVLE